MNNITIIGNLTKDPVRKQTKNGQDMMQFSVADNGYKRGTAFFSCTFFGANWAKVISYAKKGSLVMVSGELTFNGDFKNVTGGNFSFVNTGKGKGGGAGASHEEEYDDEVF